MVPVDWSGRVVHLRLAYPVVAVSAEPLSGKSLIVLRIVSQWKLVQENARRRRILARVQLFGYALLARMRQARALGVSDKGMPLWVVRPPRHLLHMASYLAEPHVAARCVVVQQDEKDIYRMEGQDGLMDDGSGQVQRLLAELEGRDKALKALADQIGPVTSLTTIELNDVSARLGESCGALKQLVDTTTKETARVDAKKAKLARQQGALSTSDKELAIHARLERHKAFLQGWSESQRLVVDRVADFTSTVDSLLALSPDAAKQQAKQACTLLTKAAELVQRIFYLAQKAASKVLTCITTSVFECHAWTVTSVFWTHDTTTTWQMKEMMMRAYRSAYSELATVDDNAAAAEDGAKSNRLLPIVTGADKAYFQVVRCDSQGWATSLDGFYQEVNLYAKLATWDDTAHNVMVKE